MKPITLETRRLILRRAIDSDINNLFNNYTSDRECSRFLTREAHQNPAQTAAFLDEWCNDCWENGSKKFAWVVATKETNEAIGVFLVTFHKQDELQIHYGISRKFWKQGLATEFASRAVTWLLQQQDVASISALCDISNVGSMRVLEKIGFKRICLKKDILRLPAFSNASRDCYLYTLKR